MPFFTQPKPLVSICIPAYDAQPFLARVLDHALAQTVSDFEIVISNDGGSVIPDLDTYRAHPKITVQDQPRRLGWVKNTNAALEMASGRYFMVLPHDDLILPTYLEDCLALLASEPDTFAAYSDIQLPDTVLQASEVRGDLTTRISHMMRNLYNGYSFRALMRRNPRDWPLLKLRENPPTNCCVDTTWILQQALFGELRRVPKPLYIKSIHAHNTHSAWETLPPDMLRTAWTVHCKTMGDLARQRLGDHDLIDRLVHHRMDPRRVREHPPFLRTAFGGTDIPHAPPQASPGRPKPVESLSRMSQD